MHVLTRPGGRRRLDRALCCLCWHGMDRGEVGSSTIITRRFYTCEILRNLHGDLHSRKWYCRNSRRRCRGCCSCFLPRRSKVPFCAASAVTAVATTTRVVVVVVVGAFTGMKSPARTARRSSHTLGRIGTMSHLRNYSDSWLRGQRSPKASCSRSSAFGGRRISCRRRRRPWPGLAQIP
jgi:hypothetical protein